MQAIDLITLALIFHITLGKWLRELPYRVVICFEYTHASSSVSFSLSLFIFNFSFHQK